MNKIFFFNEILGSFGTLYIKINEKCNSRQFIEQFAILWIEQDICEVYFDIWQSFEFTNCHYAV